MTGDRMIYPYTSDSVPEVKINYSYAKFGGEAFLKAWEKSRDGLPASSKSDDIPKLNAVSKSGTEALFIKWADTIDTFKQEDKDALNLLLKRFEVTKKIYAYYDENFRPLNKKEFKEFRLYLFFAYVLVLAYGKFQKLQYLNSLLKVNDINAGLVKHFNSEEKYILSICVQKERDFVLKLRDSY